MELQHPTSRSRFPVADSLVHPHELAARTDHHDMSCSKNTWKTVAEGDGTVYKLTDACAALFDCAVGSYCPAGSFSGPYRGRRRPC